MRITEYLFKSRRILLGCIALIGLFQADLQAGPGNLVEFSAVNIGDLTVDATCGFIYFQAGGQNYTYKPG